MFISPQFVACSVLFVMKPGAFPARDLTIRLCTSFGTAEMALVLDCTSRFSSSKFTAREALMNAYALVLLTLVNAWCALSVCLHNDSKRYRDQKGNYLSHIVIDLFVSWTTNQRQGLRGKKKFS
jgi:hypothetical protein